MEDSGFVVIKRSFVGEAEDLIPELQAEAIKRGFGEAVEHDELYWEFCFGTCSQHVTVISALPPQAVA